jgi:hypothetical protein
VSKNQTFFSLFDTIGILEIETSIRSDSYSLQFFNWFFFVCKYLQRWASTSISMSAISDIRHRHLLFRYRRQICRTEKRHSDIGSVPISTSELIPISDIEEKNISICKFEPTSLGFLSKRYNTEILRLSMYIWMSDIGYRIKLYSDIRYNVGLHSLSPISEVPISGSVRYR